MSHNCGTSCKRKTGRRCVTCRRPGTLPPGVVHVEPPEPGPQAQATRHAAADRRGGGYVLRWPVLSSRGRERRGLFGRPTAVGTVFGWVKDQTDKAKSVVDDIKVETGPEWVADELAVKLNGRQYWIFNVMDAKTRFVLAAYLSPERTTRAAQTAMAMARDRSANAPSVSKDRRPPVISGWVSETPSRRIRSSTSSVRVYGLKSTTTCPNGCKAHSRPDKTLRGLKKRDSGQAYIEGWCSITITSGPHRFTRPATGGTGRGCFAVQKLAGSRHDNRDTYPAISEQNPPGSRG